MLIGYVLNSDSNKYFVVVYPNLKLSEAPIIATDLGLKKTLSSFIIIFG